MMMPFSVKMVLSNKMLEITPYEEKRQTTLISTGIYGTIRHPMQNGLLLFHLFSSGVYTTDRLLFVGLIGIFIVVGVLME